MMLPNAGRVQIDRTKIAEYLLSTAHAAGWSKAEFFGRFGFKREECNVLADALRLVALANPVVSTVESAHGTRYIVDGPLQTPDGRAPNVRTVWIVEPESLNPRFITAHPL